MQKNEILVQTASVMGGFWTIQKITPKSASLSLTILYLKLYIAEGWKLFSVP